MSVVSSSSRSGPLRAPVFVVAAAPFAPAAAPGARAEGAAGAAGAPGAAAAGAAGAAGAVAAGVGAPVPLVVSTAGSSSSGGGIARSRGAGRGSCALAGGVWASAVPSVIAPSSSPTLIIAMLINGCGVNRCAHAWCMLNLLPSGRCSPSELPWRLPGRAPSAGRQVLVAWAQVFRGVSLPGYRPVASRGSPEAAGNSRASPPPRLRGGALRRPQAQALAQLRYPAAHRLLLAGELAILLECRERPARVSQIEIREHAKVPPGRGVSRVGRDRLLVRGDRVLEFSAQPLGRAELGPGDRAPGLTGDGALQDLLGHIEAAILALEDREVDERGCELRVLKRRLLEAELGLELVSGTHEIHRAIEVIARRRRNLGMHGDGGHRTGAGRAAGDRRRAARRGARRASWRRGSRRGRGGGCGPCGCGRRRRGRLGTRAGRAAGRQRSERGDERNERGRNGRQAPPRPLIPGS